MESCAVKTGKNFRIVEKNSISPKPGFKVLTPPIKILTPNVQKTPFLNLAISPEGKQINIVKPYKNDTTPKPYRTSRNYRKSDTPVKLNFSAIEIFRKITNSINKSMIQRSRKLTEIETAGVINTIASICKEIKLFENKKSSNLINSVPIALNSKKYTWFEGFKNDNNTILTDNDLKILEQANLCNVSANLLVYLNLVDCDLARFDRFFKTMESILKNIEQPDSENVSQTQNIISRKIKPKLVELIKNGSLLERLITANIFQEYSSDLFLENDCVWSDSSEEYNTMIKKVKEFNCRTLRDEIVKM